MPPIDLWTGARLLLALMTLPFGIWCVSRAWHDGLWRLTVGATEYGYWLVPLALLAMVGPLGDHLQRAATAIAVLSLLLLLSPAYRASRVAPEIEALLTLRFGNSDDVRQEDALRLPTAFSWRGLLGPAPTEHPILTETYAPGRTLDLYGAQAPGASAARPLVVVVHGGSWQNGDASQLPALNHHLASRAFVVASLNYRKAPAFPFPAARDDVRQAIRWLRLQGARFGIDSERIVLLGRSAGGQLALSALEDASLGLKGLVIFYAPTDMHWSWSHPSNLPGYDSNAILRDYLGGTPDSARANFDAASPLLQLRGAPPMLLIHGQRDVLVSPEQSRRLASHLAALGVPHALVEIPAGTHGCDANFNGPGGQLSTYAVERFLAAVLGD